jgi:hypothetical protein
MDPFRLFLLFAGIACICASFYSAGFEVGLRKGFKDGMNIARGIYEGRQAEKDPQG